MPTAPHTLSNETVTNGDAIEVSAGDHLTLDNGTTVNNATGAVTVDGTLTLSNATISGGLVTIDGSGTLDLNGSGVLDPGTLDNAGKLNVSGRGNALDDETVTGTGAIEVLAGAR